MASHFDDVSTHTLRRDSISPDQLERELETLGPRWAEVNGALHLLLPGSMSRIGVVAAFAGALADELDHHPRILLDRDGMSLAIQSYDAISVTVTDLVYAARLEQWLRANGWS